MRRLAATALTLAALVVAATASGAETIPGLAEMEAARTELDRAAEALKGARRPEDKLAALGQAVAAQEAALAAYRAALRAMALEERRTGQRLVAERARLAELIGALQSLARAPRSALMVFPGGPLEAARASELLAAITPALDARRQALVTELDRLARLRAGQESARSDARTTLAALQELRAETDRQLDRRRPRLPDAALFREQAAAAAASAGDLDQLATKLRTTLREVQPRVPFSLAQGSMSLPVAGRVTARFGDPDPWGRTGTGLTVSAPAWAQVSAPWDGTVRFAGRLIDYGNVVVLEPETDWMIVLAGLAHVDREAGEQVLLGEKLGDLGDPLPSGDEFLREAGNEPSRSGQKRLYIEIRHHGEPVDPSPWLGIVAEKAND